jgi:cold shock CspA family protein
MEAGTIKFYDEEAGFGVITLETGEGDVLFSKESFMEEREIVEGTKAVFEIEEASDGFHAINIRISD